jgi:hypothetical protein
MPAGTARPLADADARPLISSTCQTVAAGYARLWESGAPVHPSARRHRFHEVVLALVGSRTSPSGLLAQDALTAVIGGPI